MGMRSYADLVEDARAAISELEPGQVRSRLGDLILVDVREPEEYEAGTVEGALLMPRGNLESLVESRLPDRRDEIVLFCAGGSRSALAAVTLKAMGYGNTHSMAGGFNRWKDEGLPWTAPSTLTSDQRVRYNRHISLPEVGEAGQHTLLGSSVVLVGAGGLGSPVALYLAAAGVGTIGVVDFDSVDASNLQRQILHNFDRLGMLKVDSARETLTALNPDVKVVTHSERLTAANALELLAGYDLIVDGGDNFPTRYLVNDVSLHLRTPVIHGSVYRFEGQAAVFSPYEGPCYRCLFPQPPPPELAPSCAEAGVLGVLPGIIGSIQAMEAIKMLLALGDSMVGRLLVYDALEQDFQTVKIRRNPDCAACGDADAPPLLVDYDQTCAPADSRGR